MWKKILMLLMGLVGTFSVVYASNHLLSAAGTTYHAGGDVTGRVNMAPAGISGNQIGIQKGDKVYLHSKFQGEQMSFQINSDAFPYTLPNGNTVQNAHVAKSEFTLATDTYTDKSKTCTYVGNQGTASCAWYSNSNLLKELKQLNASNYDPQDNQIVYEFVKRNINPNNANTGSIVWPQHTDYNSLSQNVTPYFFNARLAPAYRLGDAEMVTDYAGLFDIDPKKTVLTRIYADFTYKVPYWQGGFASSLDFNMRVITPDGVNSPSSDKNAKFAILANLLFNKSDVVFAVSSDVSKTGVGKVKQPTLSNGYTSIYYETQNDDAMKLRLLDSNYHAELKAIQNNKKETITQIAQGGTLYLQAEANNYLNSTVSILLFDENDNFAYYQPIAAANGDDTYSITLDGIEPSNYKVAIVNEAYNETSNAPIDSSLLSDVLPLTITDALSVSTTLTPQNQATFEYSKNVDQGDPVLAISHTGGIDPITFTLVSDTSDAAHTNDYTNFSMDTDMNGNPIVVVAKQNGLDAGTYSFKIKAVDANGDPKDGLVSSTITITVAKTDPDLKFTITTAIDKIVGDSAFTEAFTHNNTDTSDANFSLTYSSSNPLIASVDNASSNTDTDVEITPGNQNGTTTIKVELAETENFKSASASLTVNVHPKISLAFTSEKPAFAVNEVLTQGTKIGKVTLTGNSPDYTYSMAVDPSDTSAGANNGMFKVSSSTATNTKTMDILTDTANIGQGTYKITIKVVDAYGQVAYAKGTINVSGTAQTDFKFYDYTNPSSDITDGTLTLYYGETSAKLIASGTQSTGAVTYELDVPTTDIIEVDPDEGNITVKKVGKVKVKATKAADSTYNASTIYMYVEVKQAEQEIAFVAPNTTTITYDVTNGNSFSEKANGKIKTGMPNAGNAGVGGITYSLGGSDTSIASINSSTGDIQINAGQNITSMKTFTVTAKLNESGTASYNANYEGATVTKIINVYPPGSATWNQTNKPEADKNDGNEKIGDLSVTGGSGNVAFTISTSGDADNLDKEFFHIDPTSGEVVLKKQITVNDLISKTYNTTQKAYEMKVMVDVSDAGNVNTEHLTIYITGAERANLNFKNKDNTTQEITETYDVNKQFQLSLTQNITGTEYRISMNPSHTSPVDVISVNTNGKADILNANEVSIAGSTTSPVYVEAIVPASNGYKEMIDEAPVRIKRKDQTLTFSQDPINTSADIQSLNVSVSGHMDTQPLIFTSDNNMIDVNADPSDLDQVIIKPNSIVANGIKVSAQAQGDRNYKDIKEDVTLNIAQAGTQLFSAVFPGMTYGDAGPFKVSIIPAGDGTEAYTYEVKDTSILDIDSSGNITIHHAGSTNVKVTKTSSGGIIGPYTFNVTVRPKPITITIDDEEKYVGMAMPTFHANIPTLVGSDTLPQPDFICEKADGTVVNAQTEPGRYDILGNYANPNPDYKITISKGELTVKQDTASASWYHLEDADGNTTQSSIWHKDLVDIVLNPNNTATAGAYDEISGDSTFTNTDKTRFTVSNEGETTQDIYFRINPSGSDPNKGSITPPIQETIRIDNTAPIIKSISGKDNGNSKTREFLNAVTFGQFFKPGLVVNIQAEDIVPNVGTNISGIAKTSYVINQLDSEGNPVGQGNTIDQQDDNIEISLKEPGNYEVCATATDNAGNESSEKCEVFEVKKIDVDVDKDGKPDFNDPDRNGCADFNIVYKDEDGNWVTLNEDKDRDGIPERNIDTNGDGEPDINVDTDNDGKPDLNLVILTEDDWKPAQCVSQHGEQYASIVSIKPQINIDSDPTTPNIPDINIDTDGDMKPNLNITKPNNKVPYLNVLPIKDWKPDQDYSLKNFIYDTMEWKMPLTNYDSDNDGKPDINIDFNNDGVPDLNIDSDYNGIPELNIDGDGDGIADYNKDLDDTGKPTKNIIKLDTWKPVKDGIKDNMEFDTINLPMKDELNDNEITVLPDEDKFMPTLSLQVKKVTDTYVDTIQKEAKEQIKDQEIQEVYDIKLLENDIEIQPDNSIHIRIPLPKGLKNPRVLMKQKDGTYKIVESRIENEELIITTDTLGIISILGDKEQEPIDPVPEDPEEQKPEEPKKPEPPKQDDVTEPKTPNTSVKGTYTKIPQTSGIGGAYTGDDKEVIIFIFMIIISLESMLTVWQLKRKEANSQDTF